jgi:uncharacterized membrane protein
MSEQGREFSTFIQTELKAEQERKKALEARGLAIGTQSGGFLALVVALTTLVTGSNNYTWSERGTQGLFIALMPLVVAILFGFRASSMNPYEVQSLSTLEAMTRSKWEMPEVDARSATAQANVKQLRSLRIGNNKKAFWVNAGYWLQFAGLVSLFFSVGFEVSPKVF